MCAKIVISRSYEAKVLRTAREMLRNNIRRAPLPGYDMTVAFEYDDENELPINVFVLPEDLARHAGTDTVYVVYIQKKDNKGR